MLSPFLFLSEKTSTVDMGTGFSAGLGGDEADDGSFIPDPIKERRRGLRMLCLHGHASNNDIMAMQVIHLDLRNRHGISVRVPLRRHGLETMVGGDRRTLPNLKRTVTSCVGRLQLSVSAT